MSEDRSKCPICDSKLRLLRSIDLYSECVRCKSLSTKTVYNEEQIKEYYSSYITDEVDEFSDEIRSRVSQKIRDLTAINNAKSMYDYGFGSGIFLKEGSRLGLDCFGYEYSDGLIEKGVLLGATIEDAQQLNAEESPRVDIFIVIETLEHLVLPKSVLETAFRRLNKGGVLYMTTPNARSLNRRLLGGRWSVFNPPEHITIFSADSVRILLQEIGFGNISVTTSGFNPHDLIRAIRTRSKSANSDFSYDGTKRTETSRSLITLSDRNVLFRLLFKAVNGLLTLLSSGDTLKIIARKP